MCSIPLLTGWYSQKKTQNVLATYEQVVEQTTGDEIEQLRNQADEYNKNALGRIERSQGTKRA